MLIILIIVFIFTVGVLGCWILGIIFAINHKREIRNVFFILAGIGTVIFGSVGMWIYDGIAYEKIETREGTVRVSSNTVSDFQQALEIDDVQEVKKLLGEEPALRQCSFELYEVNFYGYAIMNDSYEVVRYFR